MPPLPNSGRGLKTAEEETQLEQLKFLMTAFNSFST